MRQGQASPPSNFHGKAPMMQRVLSTRSMSPPTFSAWTQPSGRFAVYARAAADLTRVEPRLDPTRTSASAG